MQGAASFTDWGWLLYLAIPCYAFYKLCINFILPYFKKPKVAPVVIDEAEQKRAERAAGRAERRQQKRR